MTDTATGTRSALLQATQRCVRDHGLSGTTSRRITEAAGANLAAITYHFGSKDELVGEALFADLSARIEPALAAFDNDVEPTQALATAVQLLVTEFERSRDDAVLYLEALMLAMRTGAHRDAVLSLYRDLAGRLTELVGRLRSEGVVPKWVEPKAAASLVLAIANGIAVQATLDPDGPGAEDMAAQFAGMLVATAATSAAAHPGGGGPHGLSTGDRAAR